jgi:DNA polymerase III alpha subunit
MSDVLACFTSHYSYLTSILTLEEAGKTKPGNPVSICDIAKRDSLKQVVLVDEKIDGFIEAYKNLTKAGAQLIYGIKLCVCADESAKDDASLKTESNVIIFIRGTQGYSDLIRIYNRAWTDGFYYRGRTSWPTLRAFWTENLALALPTYSSFVARNLLSFSTIVPDMPVTPTLFREVDSRLPFEQIVNQAIDAYAAASGAPVQLTKSIYYEDSARDFDAYVTFRAIGNRSEFARPNVDHLCSDRFSYSAYRELVGGAT